MRHRQRSYALQALYAYEQCDPKPDLKTYKPFAFVKKQTSFEYAQEIFYGVTMNKKTIDGILEKTLNNWSIERLHIVDRCILRLSVYSLYFERDLPFPVVIDEAIELAKRYSERKSPSFINGILDTIAKENKDNHATIEI